MVDYKDTSGNIIGMEDALRLPSFTVSWVDAEVTCDRRAEDSEEWSVKRMVNGLTAGQGVVTRKDYVFYRNGSAHQYNTFYEAARRVIEPVGG